MGRGGPGRAQQRSTEPIVTFGLRVPYSAREHANALAEQTGLSINGLVAHVIQHLSIDDAGQLTLISATPGANPILPDKQPPLPGLGAHAA